MFSLSVWFVAPHPPIRRVRPDALLHLLIQRALLTALLEQLQHLSKLKLAAFWPLIKAECHREELPVAFLTPGQTCDYQPALFMNASAAIADVSLK
jgi:hypothetical protein